MAVNRTPHLPATITPDQLTMKPIAEAVTLSADWYTNDGVLVAEKDRVFSCEWQIVGHASELTNVGAHIVAEVAGKPIIIVRGADHVLRAFFNVCRHRAGPIAKENGCSRNLVCKYHGWTYDLTGQLIRAPEMEGACQFNVSDVHLEPVKLEVWQGLLFVALTNPVASVEALLSEIPQQILPITLPSLSFERRVIYDVACNWKVYVDNYLEGYHLPLVHPGLSKVLDYRAYNTQLFEKFSYQHSPLDGTQGPYAMGDAHYYFIFPNMMLNILPNRLQTNIVLPNGADRCKVVFDYFYGDRTSDLTEKLIQEDAGFADEVQQEDIDICEHVQKGLNSGAYYAGRYSPKRETGVWHFHQLLRRAFA